MFFFLAGLFVGPIVARRRHGADRETDGELPFSEVFDSIPDMMGIQDTDRHVLRYNAAGYRALGIGPEEIRGKRCYEIIGRVSPCTPCATEMALREERPSDLEKFIPETDTWYNVRAYPIRDSEGKISRVIEHLRDISEEKRLTLQLEHLNQTLEHQVQERTLTLSATIDTLKETQEFLIESEKLSSLARMVAGISHEVNTPLGVAVTSASFLSTLLDQLAQLQAAGPNEVDGGKERLRLIGKLGAAADLVTRNLERAKTLMGGFRQIAADQASERAREIDIPAYLRDLVASLAHELKRAGVVVEFDGDSEARLVSYPGAISQVFTNLILNSLQHGFSDGRHGVLSFQVTAYPEGVAITYRDDGAGMDAETRKHMYEPFFTRRIGSGGIGLGMNIVYNLVAGRLQGRIECESSPGEGVTFEIRIPDIVASDG